MASNGSIALALRAGMSEPKVQQARAPMTTTIISIGWMITCITGFHDTQPKFGGGCELRKTAADQTNTQGHARGQDTNDRRRKKTM